VPVSCSLILSDAKMVDLSYWPHLRRDFPAWQKSESAGGLYAFFLGRGFGLVVMSTEASLGSHFPLVREAKQASVFT